jgi:hypothetical protein
MVPLATVKTGSIELVANKAAITASLLNGKKVPAKKDAIPIPQ